MNRIPTIKELELIISNDLKGRLGIIDDETKKNINAISAVLAAQMKTLYLALSDVQDEILPDRATTVANGGALERIGNIHLNRNPNPATQGVFSVSVNGVANSVIRSGLTFKSNDDSLNPGQLYITETETILNGNNDLIQIRSLGIGTEFDLVNNDTLSITEPVIGVERDVIVDNVISKPLAAESLDDYRNEIILNIQSEPSGGSASDYRLWASDAQGVLNVYPYLKENDSGTIQVYVEATEEDSSDGLGTPSQSILDAVLEVILLDPDESKELNKRGRKPIQATIEMLPINLVPIDVNIVGLDKDETAIRISIENNISDFLREVRPFVAGADLERNKNDVLFSAKIQSIVSDTIESSNFFTTLDLFVNGVNQITSVFTRGDVPYLRNLDFI